MFVSLLMASLRGGVMALVGGLALIVCGVLAPVEFAEAAQGATAAKTHEQAPTPLTRLTPREDWQDDLRPIAASDWNATLAAHLLERAGFGGTPEEVARYTAIGPRAAVRRLVRWQQVQDTLPAFDESGIFDPGLDPFPPSRPAATEGAKRTGQSMGIAAKPEGVRRLQPVTNTFFYWLRASRLETHRMSYWWAQRMLTSERPLQEKLALFWHGHFATSEEKVRDYRKMLLQNQLFRDKGNGRFRELMIAVAQDPAMLVYLDAGANRKGAPNENFAREIMEMFTLGVGHYSESDIREAARAFTGWDVQDLKFVVRRDQHDEGVKRVLGREGRFDGVDVIDILLAQPAAADYLATRLYRYFVRDDPSPALREKLANTLRSSRYDIAAFLETVFLSRDFNSAASVATRIKPPVELVVSTYRKVGLKRIPGIPDFNEVTASLGQKLFYPPTVAGWTTGRSWITPGLLIARGNFVYDAIYPDVYFVPHDRVPPGNFAVREMSDKMALGIDPSQPLQPAQAAASSGAAGDQGMAAASSRMADADEDFNTRLGSLRGWQMAIQRVKPIVRDTAAWNMATLTKGCSTPDQVVDVLLKRFVSVPVSAATREGLVRFLRKELGTDDLQAARSYADEPLRQTLHLILSLPEYQLG